jgi:hypothetical protein
MLETVLPQQAAQLSPQLPIATTTNLPNPKRQIAPTHQPVITAVALAQATASNERRLPHPQAPIRKRQTPLAAVTEEHGKAVPGKTAGTDSQIEKRA